MGIKRFDYKIPTGMYAIGAPTKQSPLIVSCNYKLTFDLLRRDLEGMNVWLLILDTKGINVWCAAGKGTFGTRELLYQLNKYQIKSNLECEKIIVPQLGAVSMEPHVVKEILGIDIIYGPVRSNDLKAFIQADYNATEDMRKVTFTLKERLVLIPVEVVMSLKYYAIAYFLIVCINLLLGKNSILLNAFEQSLWILVAMMIGLVLFPILLPVLPFRYFSLNGLILSFPISLFIFKEGYSSLITMICIILFNGLVMWESYLLTGSTTFTSLSGVEIEAHFMKKISLVLGGLAMILLIGEVLFV